VYSYGDCLVICNNWNYDQDKEITPKDQSQFTLTESLHGREILCSTSFSIGNRKHFIITGSEDSFLKVSEYDSLD